jgi:hypothetical protein
MTTPWRSVPAFLVTVLVLAACAAPAASVDPTASTEPVASSSPTPAASPSEPALPEGCRPEGPPSLADVIAVPIGDRPDCFGTADLTLRGWVFEELDPVYDCVTMPQQPGWLSCILSRQQLVAEEQAPGPWSENRPTLGVAADPDGPVGAIAFGTTEGPVAVNTWVEVTGHFADPAAEDCGPPGDPLRIECEGTLVLTAVSPVEAEPTSGAVNPGAFASVTVLGGSQ